MKELQFVGLLIDIVPTTYFLVQIYYIRGVKHNVKIQIDGRNISGIKFWPYESLNY